MVEEVEDVLDGIWKFLCICGVVVLLILFLFTCVAKGFSSGYKSYEQDLERNGYIVHKHTVTIDGVTTNWIEIVKKDNSEETIQ